MPKKGRRQRHTNKTSKKENKNKEGTPAYWNCPRCFCSWDDKDRIICYGEYAEHVNHCNGLPGQKILGIKGKVENPKRSRKN